MEWCGRKNRKSSEDRSGVIFHLLEYPEKVDDEIRAIHDKPDTNKTNQCQLVFTDCGGCPMVKVFEFGC